MTVQILMMKQLRGDAIQDVHLTPVRLNVLHLK